MICSLKSSMAVLAAALALAGGSTSAIAAEFHTSAEHPIISVTQTTPFQFNATEGSNFLPISCSVVKASETWASTSTNKALSFQPVFEGCKDWTLERPVHVTMNGCQYSLTATEGSGSTYTGQMAINCPAGKVITTVVTTSGLNCVVAIPPQTGLGTVHYAASENDVLVTFQIKGLKSNIVGGGFGSCVIPIGEKWGGAITGAITVNAGGTYEEPLLLSVY